MSAYADPQCSIKRKVCAFPVHVCFWTHKEDLGDYCDKHCTQNIFLSCWNVKNSTIVHWHECHFSKLVSVFFSPPGFIINHLSPSVPSALFSATSLNILWTASSEFLSEFPKYFVAGGPTFSPFEGVIKLLWIYELFFFSALKRNYYPESSLCRASSSSSSHCLREWEWITAWGMVFLTQLCAWLYCRFMNINWGLTLLLPEMHAERWHLAWIIYTAIKT